MAAEICRAGHWHHVVPDCRPLAPGASTSTAQRAGQAIDAPLQAASFHMLPYSNRIRDGRFEFQGKQIQLANAQNHAIHGALSMLPWQIDTREGSSLTCRIRSVDHPSVNWPWPVEAMIRHDVQGDCLSSTLILTNRGASDMPAGFGWHPYFVRQVNGASPNLTLPVDKVFPDENGDCLPDGAAVPLPGELDFRKPRKLDENQRIDCCLEGLSGACVIDWREGGIKLIMTASDICRYLVLYNPAMPHFAVEPVSNANDAFNLESRGIVAGMQILAPDESMQATLQLRVVTC